MYLELLYLNLIVIFIVELSGFDKTFKEIVSLIITKGRIRTSNYSLRPFTCALCMTFWCGLFHLIASGCLFFNYFVFLCLLSLLSSYTSSVIRMVLDMIAKIIDLIYRVFKL